MLMESCAPCPDTDVWQCAAAYGGRVDSVFVDDAIRIWKYHEQHGNSSTLQWLDIDTVGALSVHINANRDGNGQRFENWLDYAIRWCVSLTWSMCM